MCAICGVLSQFVLFCCKISFVTIYNVLSQNLCCRDLRPFAWRNFIYIVYVEKNDKYEVCSHVSSISFLEHDAKNGSNLGCIKKHFSFK